MQATRRLLLSLVPVCLAAAAAGAQTPPLRIRGTIDSVSGQTLHLISRSGTGFSIAVGPHTSVSAIVPASLADIQPNSFVGTAAKPLPDGSLQALEVHIFPEAMRGTGEGYRPWDLGPNSSMTNATVASVVGTSGRTLTLDYQGGEKRVVVPAGVPIVTFAPGSPAMLTVGAHVIVFAQKSADGVLTAGRIAVGKDGLVPPM